MYQQHDQASYKTNLQESNNRIARLGLKLSIEYDHNSTVCYVQHYMNKTIK